MSKPEEGRFLPWLAAGPSSARSPLPGASPKAGESISMQRGGGCTAEGGREQGAGAMVGTCRVTGARQYLLMVLSITNSKLNPGTHEMELFFSLSLGLHTKEYFPSASTLLSPE